MKHLVLTSVARIAKVHTERASLVTDAVVKVVEYQKVRSKFKPLHEVMDGVPSDSNLDLHRRPADCSVSHASVTASCATAQWLIWIVTNA